MSIEDLPAQKATPSFDFEKEARTAFENFAELKKNSFLTYYDALERKAEIFTPDDHEMKRKHPALFDTAYQNYTEALQELMTRTPGYGSAASKYFVAESVKVQGVFLDHHAGALLYAKDPSKGLAYILDHEIGHLLVKNAHSMDGNKTVHYNESAADAFAAIRTFQRYGNTAEARDILEHISQLRTHHAITHGDYSHITTSALDQILEDSLKVDFSQVSFKDMTAFAEKYAVKHQPIQKDFDKANVFFASRDALLAVTHQGDKNKLLESLSSTCLSVGDKYSFSIGIKIIQPLLDGLHVDSSLTKDLSDKARGFGMTATAHRIEGKTAPLDIQIPASKFLASQTVGAKLIAEIRNLKRELLTPIRNAIPGMRKQIQTTHKNQQKTKTLG